MAAEAPLRLKLFGGFQVRRAEGPVIWIAARKTRALLAYLALAAGRAHGREKLADLLWSDRGDKQARDSLRQALAELRDALADIHPAPLTAHHDLLSVDPVAVEVDAVQFEGLAAHDSRDELGRAAALYDGDLLEGLGVHDPAFDDWLRDERQRYRELAVAVLKKLLAQETRAPAMTIAQRLLALDPLQEEGYRTLMRLHAEAGDIASALRQYDICCATLRRELDIAPSAETAALHRQIRDQSTARTGGAHTPPSVADVPQPSAAATSIPSIAVLPFRNLSGDPAQQYFSDGITEDIITELSRFRSLTVMAHHSFFASRDQRLDSPDVAQRLGVHYVVEGSVRRFGDTVRITAQLSDARSSSKLWADHYDRESKEIFAIQDEVVRSIVTTLPGRIADAGVHSARRKRPENLTAYEYYLRGLAYMHALDATAEPSAREMLDNAIALDPQFAPAYACLAALYMRDWWNDLSAPALDQVLALAKRAAALDPNDSLCCWVLGYVCLHRKRFEDALVQFERASALNPNDSDASVAMSWWLTSTGRSTEAIDKINDALRLNPYPPPWYFASLGMALYAARRYAEAIAALGRGFATPDAWTPTYLAAAYGQLGRSAEAQAQVAKFREQKPGMTMLHYAAHEPYGEPADLEHLLDGVRKADPTAPSRP